METILVAKATEALQKQIDEDLKIPDPLEEIDEQSETENE
jgi:hypothetical protein